MLIFTDRLRSPTARAPEGTADAAADDKAAEDTTTDDAAADDTTTDDAAADDPADACESCLGWRAETQVASTASASVVRCRLIVRSRLLEVPAVVRGLSCRKYKRGKKCEHNVGIIQ